MLAKISKILTPLLSPISFPLLLYSFSTCYPEPVSLSKKISPMAQRHAMISYQIRRCLNVEQAMKFVEENLGELEQVSPTIVLDYFNQFYMDPRADKAGPYLRLNELIGKFHKLNTYEKTLRISILQKTKVYYKYKNQLDLHEEMLKKSVDSLIEDIDTLQLTINDFFNIMFAFRVQTQQKLVGKCLEKLNLLIPSLTTSQQYTKMWLILFHQLEFYSWNQLRVYENIINFFTTKFSIEPSSNMSFEQLARLFEEMCKFRFHLVGSRKLPLCLKEIVDATRPKMEFLTIKQLSIFIKACAELPAQFEPSFKRDLIKTLREKTKRNIAEHDRYFPYAGLTVDDINSFFVSEKVNFAPLWFNFLYQTNYKAYHKFLRGVIPIYFNNYIASIVDSIEQKGVITNKNQTSPRVCNFVTYLYQNNDQTGLENVRKIIKYQVKSLGIDSFSQFSMANFLNLMILFHNDPLITEITAYFYETLQRRRQKTKLYDSGFYENCLEAIQMHMGHHEIQIVQTAILLLAQYIVGPESEPITDIEIRVLLQLMRNYSKQENKELEEIKKKLWKKVKNQEIECVLEYYCLSPTKSLSCLQEIMAEISARQIPLLKTIRFLSSLITSDIENNRGRPQQNLCNYLNNNAHLLAPQLRGKALKHLNQINRLLSILNNYQSILKPFIRSTYMTTIDAIHQEIWDNRNEKAYVLEGRASRRVVDFMMKFQRIVPPNELLKNTAVLEKVYRLFRVLMGLDEGPYLKVKYLQFVLVYKEYINIPQGQEIYPAYSLQVILQLAKSVPEYSQILLILLKLHCFSLQKLQNKEIMKYTSTISVQIQEGRLSLYSFIDKVSSIDYQAKIIKATSEDYNICKGILSPLLSKAVNLSHLSTDINIIRPFLNYFRGTGQLPLIRKPIMGLLNTYISPATMLYLITILPNSMCDKELFELILGKISAMDVYFGVHGMQVLYFVERLFFQVPQEYRQTVDKIWATIDKSIANKVQEIKGQDSYDKINHALGRYPLYIFSCIKSGRTKNNPNYNYFCKLVMKYDGQFLSMIRENTLMKSINQGIYLYIREEMQAGKGDPAYFMPGLRGSNIKLMPNIHYEKKLQTRLNGQKTKYRKEHVMNGVTVPFFLPEKNQIIVVATGQNCNSIVSGLDKQVGRINGFIKFHVQVYAKMFVGMKVRVYDETNDKFIN